MLESFHQRRGDVVATLRDLMHLAERVGARPKTSNFVLACLCVWLYACV